MDPVQRDESEFLEHEAEPGADIIALPQLERLPPDPDGADLGDACVVDVEVEAREDGAEPRAYSFADAQQASTFVTEAVEALVYLGCEIHA